MAGKEENREQIPGEILEKCWPKEDEKCPCFYSFKAIRGLQYYCHMSFWQKVRKGNCQLPTGLRRE